MSIGTPCTCRPIGWRLALRSPAAVTAIITQSGNGYEAGFVDSFWKTVWDYPREQTPETEAAIRQAFTLEVTRWQYLTGVADESFQRQDCASFADFADPDGNTWTLQERNHS